MGLFPHQQLQPPYNVYSCTPYLEELVVFDRESPERGVGAEDEGPAGAGDEEPAGGH